MAITTKAKANVLEKKMVDQYLKSIALNNEAQSVADIMLIVDNPFVDTKKNDAISDIFHRFFKNTDTHPALPLFSYFSMLSAWCVQSKAVFTIPNATKRSYELDTWVLLLSETGASKSLASNIIDDAMPQDIETGTPLIQPNFVQPASNASLVEQMEQLPNHRGFWRQDEASQFIKQIDNIAGPLASMKQSLMIIKDHGNLDYATKSGGKKRIRNPVLTVFMINTIKAMQKAMSDDSMYDGTFRRFTVAMAKKTADDLQGKKFEDTGLYDIDAITDGGLESSLDNIFSQQIEGNVYTFTPACKTLYMTTFNVFWVRQYQRFMSEQKSYYRTYMMEAWRYAVFHHLTHKKSGTIVDELSLQWGLKVSMYLLNSLQQFISSKVDIKTVEPEKQFIKKLSDFIKENENKTGFGIRAVCRKFSMNKDTIMSNLLALRTHDKKFKTALFEDLKAYENNNYGR